MDGMLITLLALLAICIAIIALLCIKLASKADRGHDDERFRLMANEIFSQNSRQLREDNEKQLGEALKPLRDNFKEFQQAFIQRYDMEAKERYSLQDHLRQLIQLNDAIRREAHDLATALKGNTRAQGQWGEMILQRLLEHSGLRQGEEYTLQASLANDSGDRLRPDAIISFPDQRRLVIDSKVSLTAYLEMANTTDPTRLKVLTRAHLASVKNHINELRDKNYQSYVGSASVDFVLMFIPNEGAYLAAMQADDSLWQYAYDNRVIIASPTHLMSVVKLIEQSWRHEKQDRNAVEIARVGGVLLDKISAFMADMDRVCNAISSTQRAFDSAMTKLSGQRGIISHAERLQALGAKSSKPLTPPN